MELNTVFVCISCNRVVQEGIFNQDFVPLLLKMALPFALLLPLGINFHARKVIIASGSSSATPPLQQKPVLVFSLLLGLGMGGFVDGILLHQILQWHQMISNTVPPVTLEAKNINMFWDGIFHAFTWTVTMVGIVLMWRTMPRKDVHLSDFLFGGGMLMGWGVFNLIDSVFNHYLFRFHNVRENVPNPELYNLGFLLVALAMIGGGWFLTKKAK